MSHDTDDSLKRKLRFFLSICQQMREEHFNTNIAKHLNALVKKISIIKDTVDEYIRQRGAAVRQEIVATGTQQRKQQLTSSTTAVFVSEDVNIDGEPKNYG
jgi:hypothetical protein